MAYGETHLLFRVLGHRGSIGTEYLDYWSAGMRIQIGAVALTEAKKTAFLAAIQSAVSTFHGGSAVSAGSNSWLDKLTAAYIFTDGRYLGGNSQPTTEYIYPVPMTGGGGATLPFSVARVFTLETDIDRGRGAIGRFYWTTGQPVDSTGRWSQNQCTDARNAGVALLDAINAAARAQWSATSAVSVFSALSGEIGKVIRVGVGRAPDTQRRRDSRLLEERVSSPLTSTSGTLSALQSRTYGV